MDSGEASLELQNVCSVFDAFTVPNSLNALHPLGLVSGAIKSLRIHWKGFIENSATINVTVNTPSTNPPFTPAPQDGFEFVADPTTTVSHFAQIGHENNGSLF